MDNHMKDSQGRLVPAENIKPEDKLENQLVTDIILQAKHWNEKLATFKSSAFSDIDTLMSLLAEKYGVRRRGKKGNMTLTSFDGCRKVVVANGDFITFGPQLQIAKDIIDDCINSWAVGANSNLKPLIEHAFQVDKEGKINTANVLGLRRINIVDGNWAKAMEAINDAIRITTSKLYIRFYERDTPTSPWKSVSLDIASI